jgi:hypothetical protein
MGMKAFKVYGTTCMVVCYNIRPSSLAVHRCETTAVMHRIGGGVDGNLSTSRQPCNTGRDETRKCLSKDLNKDLLLLVEASQEEESLQYDSFLNGRLAHCQTYRIYRIYKDCQCSAPSIRTRRIWPLPVTANDRSARRKSIVLPAPALRAFL